MIFFRSALPVYLFICNNEITRARTLPLHMSVLTVGQSLCSATGLPDAVINSTRGKYQKKKLFSRCQLLASVLLPLSFLSFPPPVMDRRSDHHKATLFFRSQRGICLASKHLFMHAWCSWIRPFLDSKKFHPKMSHRILRHMHEVLNIDKKIN